MKKYTINIKIVKEYASLQEAMEEIKKIIDSSHFKNEEVYYSLAESTYRETAFRVPKIDQLKLFKQ